MAGKNHLRKSRLLDGVPEADLCPSCKRRLAAPVPTQCSFHKAIKSDAGDGMCRCCPSCRFDCLDE